MTWYWRESDLPLGRTGWTRYEDNISRELTQAYRSGLSKYTITVKGGQKYVVHLKDPLAQHPEGRESLLRAVAFEPDGRGPPDDSRSSSASDGFSAIPKHLQTAPPSTAIPAYPTTGREFNPSPSSGPSAYAAGGGAPMNPRVDPSYVAQGHNGHVGVTDQYIAPTFLNMFSPVRHTLDSSSHQLPDPDLDFDSAYDHSQPRSFGHHGRAQSDPTLSHGPPHPHHPLHPHDPSSQQHSTYLQRNSAYKTPAARPPPYGQPADVLRQHSSSGTHHPYPSSRSQHDSFGTEWVEGTGHLSPGGARSSSPGTSSFTYEPAGDMGQKTPNAYNTDGSSVSGALPTDSFTFRTRPDILRAMVDSEIPATELVDDCFHYLRVNQKRTHSLAELQQHLLNPPTQLVYYPNCLNNLFEQISKRPYSATKPNLQAQLPTVTASTYLIHASTAYPSSLPSLQNSNASQRLGHSQALPALSEQVPQQWKLWDQEITLTNNHPTETVKWEILAPFSADQFGFFTCAHRLEGQALIDAQKLADSQSNTIADCYPTSGMIGPNGKVKLLFSFVLFEQIRFNRLVLIDLEYADYKSTCPISVFLEGKEDPTQKYWLVPEREVLRGSRIGKGAFGSVFAATIRGLKCALKSWTGTKTFNAFGVCRIDLPSDFKKELAVFQTTKHRHLIPFIGAFQSETDTNAFILLKFASSGSLDRYYNVQRHGKAWTYLMGFKLALEAARGLQYLHSQGVFHRDVKSLNILVDEGEARINDFGAARLVASSDLQTVVSMHGQRHGTRYWIAPEVMNRTMDRTYTAASDVFSFGLVLFELATGELPARHEAQAKAGYFPPLPLDFCKKFPDYLEIYHRCVSFDPKKRPDFNEIVGVLESIEHRQRAIEQPAAGRKLGGSTGHRSRPSGGGALDADPFGQPSPTGSFLQQVESPALPQSSSFTPSIQHAPQAGGYASPSSSDIPSSKPHSMSPTTHYQ